MAPAIRDVFARKDTLKLIAELSMKQRKAIARRREVEVFSPSDIEEAELTLAALGKGYDLESWFKTSLRGSPHSWKLWSSDFAKVTALPAGDIGRVRFTSKFRIFRGRGIFGPIEWDAPELGG